MGLGDDTTGRRIPAGEEGSGFVTYQGEEVWSRLDSDTLRKMCAATPGGAYLHVATGTVDLKEIINTLNRGKKRKCHGEENRMGYEIPAIHYAGNNSFNSWPGSKGMEQTIASRNKRGTKLRAAWAGLFILASLVPVSGQNSINISGADPGQPRESGNGSPRKNREY